MDDKQRLFDIPKEVKKKRIKLFSPNLLVAQMFKDITQIEKEIEQEESIKQSVKIKK